ncbi:MAG: hypothetical protein EOP06_09585 [Proteobacteria bacterium]|nr:MAG: hypothetical protein EOP06_09585 [Pseudomonadota bacterium]
MSVNLVKKVQENLGLGELKKIDPNTQQTATDDAAKEHRLTQATITGVLTGIYNLSRSADGMVNIINCGPGDDWATLIFGDSGNAVIEHIGTYASRDTSIVKERFNKVAAEAVKEIKENTAGEDQLKKMRVFISAQRDNILPYLPAELGMGQLLDDDTLDDRTNKMRGPLSSLLNKIQSGFSGSETPEEAAAALHTDIDRSEKTEIILLRPAWDRPLFWAIVLGLLGAEWLLRKLGRRMA